jgi:hypothetical protein
VSANAIQVSLKIGSMVSFVIAVLACLRAFFVPRHDLGLAAAGLRQQLAVFKRKQARPKLRSLDRFFNGREYFSFTRMPNLHDLESWIAGFDPASY